MKKILGIIALLLCLGVFMAPAASATESNQPKEWKVFVWNMPSWNGGAPTWPQTLNSVRLVTETKGAISSTELPSCGFFQIDLYRYTTEHDRAQVDYLESTGKLYGPQNPAEPIVDWKLVNQGECPTETPTPTPTVTVPTPTPTPTVTSSTPTPSVTPSETPTITPTPSDTPSPTVSPSASTAPPVAKPPVKHELAHTGTPTVALILFGLATLVTGLLLYFGLRKDENA